YLFLQAIEPAVGRPVFFYAFSHPGKVVTGRSQVPVQELRMAGEGVLSAFSFFRGQFTFVSPGDGGRLERASLRTAKRDQACLSKGPSWKSGSKHVCFGSDALIIP